MRKRVCFLETKAMQNIVLKPPSHATQVTICHTVKIPRQEEETGNPINQPPIKNVMCKTSQTSRWLERLPWFRRHHGQAPCHHEGRDAGGFSWTDCQCLGLPRGQNSWAGSERCEQSPGDAAAGEESVSNHDRGWWHWEALAQSERLSQLSASQLESRDFQIHLGGHLIWENT